MCCNLSGGLIFQFFCVLCEMCGGTRVQCFCFVYGVIYVDVLGFRVTLFCVL